MDALTIRTDVGDLYVEVDGSGPPALLWHSLFVDLGMWQGIRDALAEVRRLVLIDGPGHGRSGPPPDGCSVDATARAALQVMDHLGLGTVDWIGCAWGGHVGMVTAAHPPRVRSLVSIAAPLTPLPVHERRRLGLLASVYRMFGPISLLASAVSDELLSVESKRAQPGLSMLVSDAFVAAPKGGMYRAIRDAMLGRPDLTDTFRGLDVPLLLIAGGADHLWTPEHAAQATRLNQNARAVRLEGVGHLPPLEAPKKTSELILRFWEGLPG